jgi:hypothetical protein
MSKGNSALKNTLLVNEGLIKEEEVQKLNKIFSKLFLEFLF